MQAETLSHTQQVQNLFVKNISQIKGFIIGLIPDFSAADDILQEVFLVVSRRADDFQTGTNFMAWARSIARLKVKEFVRQQSRLPCLLRDEVLETVAASVPEDDDGIWDTHSRALGQCLKSVAPKARRILELRYLRGLLPGEIASAISWSVGSVNVQLARVRRFLRDCVRRRLALEEIR